MQSNAMLSLSPSFSIYSNGKVAETAARTVEEFDSDVLSDEFDFDERKSSEAHRGAEEEDEFEFAMVARDSEMPSQTSADDIFQNGMIRPVYSVFNRDFLLGRVKTQNEIGKGNGVRGSACPKIRLPLRKLFLEERETTITTSSSSSSEADELDAVAEVTYCIWPPKVDVEEEGWAKKSRSGGCNSKRWKLKDFLRRNHSHGGESDFVVSEEIENKLTGTPAYEGKVEMAAPPCNLNGGEKQRSYLGYKNNLAGLFADVNA